MAGGGADGVEVLGRRIEVIEKLTEGPLHKADLVERLDQSRSTVDRAVRELEEAGYVERATEGYVTTQAGRLAADRYREHLADQRAILDASEVLESIPPDFDLPTELLADARVETSEPAYHLFEWLAEEAARADACRLTLPALVDSRHLRLCHSRVEQGLAVTFQAPADVLEDAAGEFPRLWTELERADGFTPESAATPPFGLVVSLVDDQPAAAAVVATDGTDVTGVLQSDHDVATEWALSVSEGLETEEPPTTGGPNDSPAAALTPLTGDRLPAGLRNEGFVRVDDRYLNRQEPMGPETAWRAGPDFPDVAAGYALERTVAGRGDGAGQPTLSDALLSRLRTGTDVALVGPPGSGKSTACKRVACNWQSSEGRTVLYRESDRGQPLTSTAALERVLERTTDEVLVVVEDAVRPEANAVFEAVATFTGRDDVVFLLDARESEWRDPEEFPVDARLRAVRQESVETVSVPALDETDCRRVVELVETVTDERLDVAPAELLDDLERQADTDDRATPGVVSLLFHRLTRYLDPLSADGVTTLDEEVDRVRRDLAGLGDAALDVGVLVNLLNVADLGVYPAYAHALAGADGVTHDDVRTALDHLEGQVLFPAGDERAEPYRTVHDVWSTRFLERLLDDAGDRAAERRVGRCVTALLTLADDPAHREAVARRSDADPEVLDPAVAAPTEWADEIATALFSVGRSYPKLAPLFGTTGQSGISMPDACSAETTVRRAEWRGRMYLAAGDLQRADREFAHLEAAAADLPDDEGGNRARYESLLGHSDVARRRGEIEAAADHARAALELAASIGAERGAAKARLALGGIANDRGEPDPAEEHLEAALSTFEALDAPLWTARTLDELGGIATARSNYDAAGDYFERSLETYRSVGDRRGEATALGNLGEVMNKRGDHGPARERLLRALEIARELGDRSMEAVFQRRLGDTARQQADYDAATEHARQALSAFEAVGDRHGVARVRRELGIVAGKQDRYGRAAEHLEAALSTFEAVGDRHGVAKAQYNLGTVAAKQADYERARERYEQALSAFEAIGDCQEIAGVHHNLGKIAQEQADYDRARERYERALEDYEAVGDRHGVARTRLNLGTVARRQGAYDEAADHVAAAREGYEAVGDEHGLGLADRNRGVVAMRRGDHDRARELLERALDRHEALDARAGVCRTRRFLGALARECGAFEDAGDRCEQAREMVDEDDSPWDAAVLDLERGRIALEIDDYGRAAELGRVAQEAFAELETPHDRARARRLRGRVAAASGDDETAQDRLETALSTFEEIGAVPDALATLEALATVASEAGDREQVRKWFDRAAALLDDAPDAVGEAHRGQVDRVRTELEVE